MEVEGKRSLVVEDDSNLRRTLESVLAEEGFMPVDSVGSMDEFHRIGVGIPYDLVLLDYRLPDGAGLEVLRVLARSPYFPAVVAISGDIGPDESFALAQAGARAFLRKPFGLKEVRDAIRLATTTAPSLSLGLRRSLGARSLHEIEEDVRETMVSEALARTSGNVTTAARLLGISRQLLNHIRKRGT